MQQVLQDPSHTGAALQLYEHLKNRFPNVSPNVIVAVVTEHGSNPQYCFEKIREESRTALATSTPTPTSQQSSLPEFYYPWTVIGQGSHVVRRPNTPRTPMSPVSQRPPNVAGVPLSLHFPTSIHGSSSSSQIRYVIKDGTRSPIPPHLINSYSFNPPQRSSSMTMFDGTTPSSSSPSPSIRPPSYCPQVSYPGSPVVSGRQSPFTFHIGGPQRLRLVPSPMTESTSMTNLTNEGERTRRPSYPLLTATSNVPGQKRFLINLPSHYGTPLQVMTTSDEGNLVESQDRTTPFVLRTPPAVVEKKILPNQIINQQMYSNVQQQKQHPSIQIKFDGKTTMVFSPSSSGGESSNAGRSTITFGVPKVTFGPRAVVVPRNANEYIKSLLQNQTARRENLRETLEFSKTRLNELTNDVDNMELDLNARRKRSVNSLTLNTNVSALHQETRKLQAEVTVLLKQIDSLRKGEGPSNVVAQCNFHEHMGSTGPVGKVAPAKKPTLLTNPTSNKFSGDKSNDKFRKKLLQNSNRSESLDSTEGEHWKCEACTFENHPALFDCELCEFPRSKFMKGTSWEDHEIGGTFKCYCCPSSSIRYTL